MAIAVLFEATATWEQYQEAMTKLEEAGWSRPKARLYHVAGPTEAGFTIVDVWDSPESLQEFGAILTPITQEIGFTPPEPRVWPAENIITPGGTK